MINKRRCLFGTGPTVKIAIHRMLIKNVAMYNFGQAMVIRFPDNQYVSLSFPQSGMVIANNTGYGKERTYIIRSKQLSGHAKRLCSSSLVSSSSITSVIRLALVPKVTLCNTSNVL